MPQKKSSRKPVKVHEMIDEQTADLMPTIADGRTARTPIAKIALVVFAVGVVAVLVANKGLFVAAIVDGHPIFRWQLNQVLASRFGKQTLDGMISESLIMREAKKAEVSVTKAEMDAKTKSLIDSMGAGLSVDQLLAYQGMSRADFDSQLKLQMTVEKLLGKDVKISDDDVANFIATESASLTATDEAGLKEEARRAILSQKINEQLQPWFSAMKAKANILRFL